ncbi:hypothetical protein Tco_1341541 [Tanacetum coccineum]
MSATVAQGYGGGDDPSLPLLRPIGTGCRGVGGQKTIRGGRGGGKDGGSKGTRKETRNLRLKKVVDKYGPLKIQFEFNDKGTMLHLGDNSARWSNLVDELVREFPMYYPSWHKIEEGEKKAPVLGWLMQHFDLTPHICSKLWPKIKQGIDQHMAKVYIDNKSALKAKHWSVKPGQTCDVVAIRSRPPLNVGQAQWDRQIDYWLDPKNAT